MQIISRNVLLTRFSMSNIHRRRNSLKVAAKTTQQVALSLSPNLNVFGCQTVIYGDDARHKYKRKFEFSVFSQQKLRFPKQLPQFFNYSMRAKTWERQISLIQFDWCQVLTPIHWVIRKLFLLVGALFKSPLGAGVN